MNTLAKIGLSAVFATAALGGGFVAVDQYFNGTGLAFSDGDRVGYVSKLSQKGILCKTWQGELAMDNFRTNDTGRGTSNTFEFTVRDPAIIAEIQEAQLSGERVNLHYNQSLFAGQCYAPTDGYLIVGVTPAKGGSKPGL